MWRARFRVMRTAIPGVLPTEAPPSAPVPSVRVREGALPGSWEPVSTHACPQQHTRGLIGALNAEWRQILVNPGARRAVARWSTTQPALDGYVDPAAVLDAVTRRGQDAVLLALLTLAREGDALAARIALQAMLGAAVRLARRTLGHAQGDLEESLSRAVAALWQVIRDYPLERRTCRAADGISLDVLAALTAKGRSRVEVPGGLPVELAEVPDDSSDESGLRGLFWAAAHPGADHACSDEQLILLLAWAVRRGAVSLGDARLLLRLHSPREPGVVVTCREVAEELGLGHAALRQRASRATRRLASAVAAHVYGCLDDVDLAA